MVLYIVSIFLLLWIVVVPLGIHFRHWLVQRKTRIQQQDRDQAQDKSVFHAAAKHKQEAQQRNDILQEAASRKGLTAMRRAKVQLSEVSFILTDLGLLVYEDEEHSPYFSREKSLPLDTDLIRPFIEIWSEFWDTFPITLEILDANEKLLFLYETSQELKHKTYIIADTWLSVKDMERGGNPRWSLRVTVDGELLAVHYIKWGSFRWKDIPYQAMADGEMDKRTSRLVNDDLLTSMSLDDLLAEEAD